MSYFKDADAWIDNVLAPLGKDERAEAKKQIKTKLLESYRNGQRAPKKESEGAPKKGRELNGKLYRVVISDEHFRAYLVYGDDEKMAEQKVKAALREGSLWDGAFQPDGDYHGDTWHVIDANLADEVNPPRPNDAHHA